MEYCYEWLPFAQVHDLVARNMELGEEVIGDSDGRVSIENCPAQVIDMVRLVLVYACDQGMKRRRTLGT